MPDRRQPDSNTPLQIVNSSGFPLQIATERLVNRTTKEHGWKVLYTEHAWFNRTTGESGFIDLVLIDRTKRLFLVVECKRHPENASWVFMHSSGNPEPRRHVKTWVTTYANGKFPFFGWQDTQTDPYCLEASFCAVYGGSPNDKNTMLERIGGELVLATEGFAQEQRDFRQDLRNRERFYFNVVVTNARLTASIFSPDDISLESGTLPSTDDHIVPYLK
ncbi:MAG TPA: hypothetical protein VMQ73_01085, partial [Methylomirabilota bacterium]|nr:hypothetical protein [Methylomirabilota bacterium]